MENGGHYISSKLHTRAIHVKYLKIPKFSPESESATENTVYVIFQQLQVILVLTLKMRSVHLKPLRKTVPMTVALL